MAAASGLSKWLMKNGKKVKDIGEESVRNSVEAVKKGASKISKGIKDADVGKNVSEAVGKAGSAADKFIKKNPKKAALGAAAAGGVIGQQGADLQDDYDHDGDCKKKKKRAYLED